LNSTSCLSHKSSRIAHFILVLVLCGSYRDVELNVVRQQYLDSLRSYSGVKYVWGGESTRGIDCSGLPRRALRDALCWRSIENFNSKALLLFFENWWYDSSARALMNGYRKYVFPIGVAGTVRGMDYSELESGDLAITIDGLHVMVYLGCDEWIQADPAGWVVIEDGRLGENLWFDVPVAVYRWEVFR